MAQRALWLAKKAALEEQMLAMERAHLPPREGALGPGTPLWCSTGSTGLPCACTGR